MPERKFVMKRIAGIVFGSALVLVFAAVLSAYLYEDKIKNIAIAEVNKYLTAEVNIKGEDIQLSFIQHFPYASLSFNNFKIRDILGDGYMAEGKSLNVLFNPLDLWNGRYNIRRIVLKDAILNIRLNENGEANYIIWKTDTTAQSGETINLQLNNISLLRVKVNYTDDESHFFTSATINEAFLNGSLYAETFLLNADADLQMHKLMVENTSYIKNQHILLKTEMDMDTKAEKYAIKSGTATVNNSAFAVDGFSQNKENGVFIKYNIKSKESKIQTLIALLPEEYARQFKDYQSSGKIFFNAKLEGLISEKQNPLIDVRFGIKNGALLDKKSNLSLQNIKLDGAYTNGSAHTLASSQATLKNFSFTLKNRQISGNMLLKNFQDPYVETDIKGSASLAELKHFLQVPYMDDMRGEIQADIAFSGKINDLKNASSRNKISLKGKLAVQNTAVLSKHYDLDMKQLNGNFHFNGNDLAIENFSGIKNTTDFALAGNFKNLAAFVFLPNQKLQADARFSSKNFNLGDFITTETTSSAKDTVYQLSFPAFLLCRLQVDIANFNYGKIVAKDITGSAALDEKSLVLSNIKFNSMGGQIDMQGTVSAMEGKRFKTNIIARCKNLDVAQLFYSMDNFGQDFITQKHIKGNLTAKTEFTAVWKSDLSADMNSIVSETELSIENGRLKDFEPLMELGKFAKIKSLNNLSFSKLSNKIYMRNRQIIIPQMDIKSSAVDMKIAGTHSFDNVMDYSMELNLSQLLFGKKKDYENEFGEIDVDENGGAKLFVKMTGPADNLKFSYDGAQSRKNLTKGFQQEKQELNKILNGTKADGTPVENLNKPQEDYELDWNENDTETEKENLNPQQQKEPSATQQNRNKAWQTFKKKISTQTK